LISLKCESEMWCSPTLTPAEYVRIINSTAR